MLSLACHDTQYIQGRSRIVGKMRVNEFKEGKMAEALALGLRRRAHILADESSFQEAVNSLS